MLCPVLPSRYRYQRPRSHLRVPFLCTPRIIPPQIFWLNSWGNLATLHAFWCPVARDTVTGLPGVLSGAASKEPLESKGRFPAPLSDVLLLSLLVDCFTIVSDVWGPAPPPGLLLLPIASSTHAHVTSVIISYGSWLREASWVSSDCPVTLLGIRDRVKPIIYVLLPPLPGHYVEECIGFLLFYFLGRSISI